MVRAFDLGLDVSFGLFKKKLDQCGCGCSERKKEMSHPHQLQQGPDHQMSTSKHFSFTNFYQNSVMAMEA